MGLEFKYRGLLKREEEFASTKNGKLPKISVEEFGMRIENGEKLVILDDMILDVKAFALQHPGGVKLIEYNIGRDVSKYFYGGYAFQGNSNNPKDLTPRHTHSNKARIVANSIAIAVLEQPTRAVACKIDHAQTSRVNSSTSTLTFKSE